MLHGVIDPAEPLGDLLEEILQLCAECLSFLLVRFEVQCCKLFLIGSSRIRRAYPDSSFIDAEVSAVVSDMTEIKEPMIKDILDEVRANPHLRSMILRVVYRFFNTSLLRGVLKIGLMAVVFFILRRRTLSLGYGADVISILLAPITIAAGRVRQI